MTLTIELTPASCTDVSVRCHLPDDLWKQIRSRMAAKNKHHCEICYLQARGVRRVECYELWTYDDGNRVRTLKFLQALCPICYRIKNLNSAGEPAARRALLLHLAQTNRWSFQQAVLYAVASLVAHKERSRFEWTSDFSALDQIIIY